MARSQSKQEDARREQETPTRLGKVHGGELVEAIAPEELESVNDAGCKHENLTRDHSETDFVAFMCDNPKCGVVVLFDKA